jgi:hypothetical protein
LLLRSSFANFPETPQLRLSDKSEAARWRDSLKGIKDSVVRVEETAIVTKLSCDKAQNSRITFAVMVHKIAIEYSKVQWTTDDAQQSANAQCVRMYEYERRYIQRQTGKPLGVHSRQWFKPVQEQQRIWRKPQTKRAQQPRH